MDSVFGDDFNVMGCHVAFGVFDGLHKGHMAVIELLVTRAKKSGQKSVLLLGKSGTSKRLTTAKEQEYLLQNTGLDTVIFSDVLLVDMQGEEFINAVLKEKLGATEVVLGENYPHLPTWEMQLLGAGISLATCETQKRKNGKVIDGDEISRLVVLGKLEEASELLGRSYILLGKVVHGKNIGHTVGMPTANLGYVPEKLLPACGVYSTVTHLNGEPKLGLASIGTRPSVDSSPKITVENYVLDYCEDLYGQVLAIELICFVRGVLKLDGLAGVKAQVDKDAVQARADFAKWKNKAF